MKPVFFFCLLISLEIEILKLGETVDIGKEGKKKKKKEASTLAPSP